VKQLFVFLLLIITLSCDDGNVDIPEFDFSNDTINDCGELVLFKINENETLIIELNEDNTENSFFTQVRDNESFTLTESGAQTITYRTFDDKPTTGYFCQNIPPTSPNIINEWNGSGTLKVTTIMTEDDEDTIDEDPNDSLDTDGDTFANFKDWDDDNDGILTKDEGATDDTDNDGILNYLDNDDDGDGVPTIEESITNDNDSDGIPDYLDADTTQSDLRTLSDNQYQEIYDTSFIIDLLKLTNVNRNTIQFDTFDYGTTMKKVTKSGN